MPDELHEARKLSYEEGCNNSYHAIDLAPKLGRFS